MRLVSDIAPGLDVLHPVSHHELRALIELPDEVGDLLEVVREVGVDHDDVVAAGGREAGEVGAPVPAPGLVHDRRAGGRGELGAPVLRAVVDHDHLARDPAVLEDAARPAHALLDVLLLVEAGDHDRNVTSGRGLLDRLLHYHSRTHVQSLGNKRREREDPL